MTYFIYAVFFLSGASALIFETIWFRLAGLIFGNSVWSAALVLGGFMAGLALGNLLTARYGHRTKDPVKLYSALELAIGLTGISLVLLFPFFENILRPVFSPFLDMPYILNPLRLSIAFILILIPTTAMGATLPILVKALCNSKDKFGFILGRLYGWNTLGAVAGSLASEIFLIRSLGIRSTGLTAVLLNLLASYCAYRISGSPDLRSGDSAAGKAPFTAARLTLQGKRLLLAAFFAGGILLALEVVWFRFLLLTRSGTSLIFAVMLSTVLSGIGIGGLLASWWYRRQGNAHSCLRALTLSSGILIIVAYWGFDGVFNAVQGLDMLSDIISLNEFILLALFLMLPVSTASGVIFTMLGQALREEFQAETGAAGMLTLANTLGAMLGSLFAGFFLLPYIGMEKSFFILAVGYGVTALTVPDISGAKKRKIRLLPYAAGTVFLLFLLLFPFGLMSDNYFAIVADKIKNEKMIAVREALTETIFYYRHDVMEEPFYYRLVTNGFSMSATAIEAKRYMKLFVYLPVALHPDIKHALLISYGVGSTAKALTDTKGLETIDVVDISRDILQMSSIVYPNPGENPLNDKRVKTHIEDGRFFLGHTDRQFDLITAEPPPPKIAGIVNLYTQEYFMLIHNRLAEGGLVSYWLPVHSLYEEDTKSIIKAFCNVFEDCSLWAGSGLDWLLLGSRNAAGPVPASLFTQQWHDPVTGPELKELGFENPEQLGSLFMADPADLKILTKNSLPLTDNFPLRLSSKTKPGKIFSLLYSELMDEDRAMSRFEKSRFIGRMWPESLQRESLRYFRYERSIKNLLASEYRSEEYYEWDELHNILGQTSLTTLPLWMLGTTQKELAIAGRKAGDKRYTPQTELLLSLQAISERNFDIAVRHFENYIGTAPEDQTIKKYPLYIFTLCMAGQTDKAGKVADTIAPLLGNGNDVIQFRNWLNAKFGLGAPLPFATTY